MHPSHRRSVALALVLFALVVLWNAWLAEDAYICLRTVDNCVHGLGLTWNPVERVQSFTCPLWTLLLTAVYAVTHEAFLTTIFVSVVASVSAAAVIAFGIARDTRQALLALAVL